MESNNKLRLLYLYQYLVKNTDPEHPRSTVQLTRMLREDHGIKVSRNTISDDLATLKSAGLRIEHYASTQNRYYFDGQTYDVAELKVLIDAVASSRFITQKRSEDLIAKLLTLTSSPYSEQLHRHVYVEGRAKSDNENGYYIVDIVNEAIDKGRKIAFQYTDYDVNKQKIMKHDGERYTVSPYALVWDGDYYYMRGFCDERGAMRNFRLDHIAEQPELLAADAVPAPESYDPAEYSKTVYRMFDTGEPEQIELFCHVSAMKYLIDAFGQDVETEPVDEEHFTARISVCPSVTFFTWVFGFTGTMRITAPESVKKAYKKMLRKAVRETEKG